MIPCKHCNTLNSLDSTFCKRCGTGLPEDEIGVAKSKLEKIVEEGFHALNLGKVEEAMAIAETAVNSDPSMVAAYSLKSNAHERRGEIAEALECAERLVELNPDSELEKIKRNQLRAALGASALQNRPPSKAVAAVAALSAAAIVLCAAVWTAKLINQRPYDSRLAMNTPQRQEVLNPGPVQPQSNLSSQYPGSPSSGSLGPNTSAPPNSGQSSQIAQPTQRPQVDAGQNDSETTADQEDSRPRSVRKSNTTDPLPNPDSGPAMELSPVNPPVPPDQPGTTPNPTQVHHDSQSIGDPGPKPELTPPPVTPDPGQIIINIHDDGKGLRAASPTGSQDNTKGSSKIFMRMGNDYYQMGNYNGAAASLEKAVSNGADPVTAYHRLAQSYSSLGKKSEAVEAYKKAIAACSNSLNAGRGDSAKLRAIRDASEAALHQLQGG